MTIQELTALINTKVTSYREYRLKYANIVLEQPYLFESLLQIAFDETNKASIRASWVLDFVLQENLALIYPHLYKFTTHISSVKHDSIVRPMAKICENLAYKYTSKNASEIKKHLTIKHIDKIIETGFDWLITPQKIAVRAYTMQTLYLFGIKKDWVHPELSHIISTKIIHESKGCKARGTKILKSIEKHRKRTS